MLTFSSLPLQVAGASIDDLTRDAIGLGLSAVAHGTAKNYAGCQQFFLDFCKSLNRRPLPADELTLSCFLSFLKLRLKVGASRLRGYVAAIKLLHTLNNWGDPFLGKPRLDLVRSAAVKGVGGGKERSPVTLLMLRHFHVQTLNNPTYESVLTLTCILVGFFGLLRISEFTAPLKGSGKPGLKLEHVQLLERWVELRLLHTKADKARTGVKVVIAKQKDHPCPVRWLAEFIRRRPKTGDDSLLFVTRDGKPVEAVWFRGMLKLWCSKVDASGTFNTHSLRIGGATAAADAGLSDSEIQRLGRWASTAFTKYIKPSSASLARLNQQISLPSLQ